MNSDAPGDRLTSLPERKTTTAAAQAGVGEP